MKGYEKKRTGEFDSSEESRPKRQKTEELEHESNNKLRELISQNLAPLPVIFPLMHP